MIKVVRIFKLIRNKRLIVSLVSIVLTLGLILSLTVQASPTSQDSNQSYFTDIHGNRQLLTKEVRENNLKLLNVYSKLVDTSEYLRKNKETPPMGIGCGASYALAYLGLPIGGVYIDVVTNTLHIGLTEIKEKDVKIIKEIIKDEVNLQCFEVKHTYKELCDLQKLIGDKWQVLKEKSIPIKRIGVDIIQNKVVVGLEELKPCYVETVKEMVGKNLPLLFVQSRIERLSDKISWHQQLFGGIRIGSPTDLSTLGFSASLGDGTSGFVMTGHAGGEGTTVYQPQYLWYWPPTWYDQVGIITRNPPLTLRWSDAAFVRATNPNRPPINKVWLGRTIVSWKSSLYTPIGTQIRFEGQYTSTNGVVTQLNQWVDDSYGRLYGQTFFSYNFQPKKGDSGGPIFIPTNNYDYVDLCGIFVGRDPATGNYYFSPLEGVWQELQVVWGSP